MIYHQYPWTIVNLRSQNMLKNRVRQQNDVENSCFPTIQECFEKKDEISVAVECRGQN